MLNVQVRYESRNWGEREHEYEALLINVFHVFGEGYKAAIYEDGQITVISADNIKGFAHGDV